MIFPVEAYTQIPQLPGIYKYLDKDKTIIYIGKAKNLKKRVSSYFIKKQSNFQKINIIKKDTRQIEIIIVRCELEALLLEAKLISLYKPKLNVIWKDNSSYLYVKITREKYPRVLTSRKNEKIKADYYGPFPSADIVREIIRYIRTIFPYCTQKLPAKRACFYSHLGLCSPCPWEINNINDEINRRYKRRLYLNNIIKIKQLLSGNILKIQKILFQEMNNYSKNQQYEHAAEIRNKLEKIDILFSYRFSPLDYYYNPYLASESWQNEQKSLVALLSKYFSLKNIIRIECFDISNISKQNATGSMVVFQNGQASKELYRKFKIKHGQISDFHSLGEVLTRRLKHIEWPFPDLIIIDGGKPQLEFLNKIETISMSKIPFIGIEKTRETIIIPHEGRYIRINYAKYNTILKFIQRMRDEAHRFAHKYHTSLRLKHIFKN